MYGMLLTIASVSGSVAINASYLLFYICKAIISLIFPFASLKHDSPRLLNSKGLVPAFSRSLTIKGLPPIIADISGVSPDLLRILRLAFLSIRLFAKKIYYDRQA